MDVVTLGAALNGSKTYTDNAVAALMGGVHYRGSVSYYDNLLSLTPEEGDAYTVKYSGSSGTDIDGGKYVWGYDEDLSDYAWISFSKNSYTKGETDLLLDEKIDGLASGTTENDIVVFGIDGYTVKDSGASLGTNYVKLANGKQLYISSTVPTNNVPDGSFGIGF